MEKELFLPQKEVCIVVWNAQTAVEADISRLALTPAPHAKELAS